jgi:small GTP-binding protein
MGVGKSATVVQFVQGIFVERYDPTIEDSYLRRHTIDDKDYLLELFDSVYTGNTDAAIRHQFYKNAHGFYAIYDILRPETLKKLEEQIVGIRLLRKSNFPLIVVGNKSDLAADPHTKVSQEQGQKFAKKYGALWAETTAKSNASVNATFDALLKFMFELVERRKREKDGGGKNGNSKSNKKDRCLVM